MKVTFLDPKIQGIDDVVQAAEAGFYGNLYEARRARVDTRHHLAALAREIILLAREAKSKLIPKRNALLIGGVPASYGVPIGNIHMYTSRSRRLAINEKFLNPERNIDLKEFIQRFHDGNFNSLRDGTVVARSITLEDIMRWTSGKMDEFRERLAKVAPEYEEVFGTLNELWRVQHYGEPGEDHPAEGMCQERQAREQQDTTELDNAYVTAAQKIIRHYQETREGLLIPDEGLTVGYHQGRPEQPIRLYAEGSLYMQLPLLKLPEFHRNELVVVAPQDYRNIQLAALNRRVLLLGEDGSAYRGERALIKEEEDALQGLTTIPNPMDHIAPSGYAMLRHFATTPLGDIDPADPTPLFRYNFGRPMNLVNSHPQINRDPEPKAA
jgi:hypothetical protein